MSKIRILSIDGGGIRGIIPAKVLAVLEDMVRKKTNNPSYHLCDSFHLIAGTSTGGIIATGLVKPGHPMNAEELVKLYRDNGSEIFDRDIFHKVASGGGLLEEKFPAKGLESVLRTHLGETCLSAVDRCDLLVTAYDIERRDPFFFKSWRARGVELPNGREESEYDFNLWEVARATSAAPTYFEPALVWNKRGRSIKDDRFALVDGGVFANNPAMCAVASIRRLYPDVSLKDLLIVSLGTGQQERPYTYDDTRRWGLVRWAQPVLDVMFDGVSDAVDYQLEQVFGDRAFWRFQTPLSMRLPGDDTPVSAEMDDASPENIERLEKLATLMIENKQNQARLAALANILATPRDPVPHLSSPPPVVTAPKKTLAEEPV